MTRATIVVTAWQHFSDTATALESIFASTAQPYNLVYVDGNSPPRVHAYLRARAAERGFTLIRSDRYLTSSEARNAALPHVNTEYAVFVDNGTIVTPGWLDALVRCADETHAWAVEPVYCFGDPANPLIYSAAPQLRIVDDGTTRSVYETAPLKDVPLAQARPTLQRTLCGYAKFHCALIRKDAIEALNAFDEGYTSYHDHRAFGLAIQQAGGQIYLEPDAVVLLLETPKLAWSDVPLFLLRWSDAWLQPSTKHFADVWGVNVNDWGLQGCTRFRNAQRRLVFAPLRRALQRAGGWRAVCAVDFVIDAMFRNVVEPLVVSRLEHKRQLAARHG